eukprot:2351138-Prymnesium_polylepis.1
MVSICEFCERSGAGRTRKKRTLLLASSSTPCVVRGGTVRGLLATLRVRAGDVAGVRGQQKATSTGSRPMLLASLCAVGMFRAPGQAQVLGGGLHRLHRWWRRAHRRSLSDRARGAAPAHRRRRAQHDVRRHACCRQRRPIRRCRGASADFS